MNKQKHVMNEYDINWPVNLNASLRNKLMAIAKPLNSIKEFEISADYWKVDGLFYVIEGLFTVGYTSEDLNLTISGIVGAGDWIGVNTLLNDNEIVVHSIKLQDTKLLYFPRKPLEMLLKQEPLLYELLFYVSKTAMFKLIKSALVCLHDREKRLAYTFTAMYQKINQDSDSNQTELPISQQQLSSVIGASRPRINETLKAFERQGFISLSRGKVIVHNIDGLKSYLNEIELLMNF
jgi:CRP/FNR family transcriptional regulator